MGTRWGEGKDGRLERDEMSYDLKQCLHVFITVLGGRPAKILKSQILFGSGNIE